MSATLAAIPSCYACDWQAQAAFVLKDGAVLTCADHELELVVDVPPIDLDAWLVEGLRDEYASRKGVLCANIVERVDHALEHGSAPPPTWALPASADPLRDVVTAFADGTDDEWENGVTEAARGERDASARSRLLDMVDAMRRAGTAVEYVCDPVAVRGAVTLLVGRTGHGKTWLGLALANAVHGGGSVVGGMEGVRCRAGKALLVDAENGARVLGKRLTDMGIGPDGLLVADATGLRLPESIDELRELVRATAVDLVVLDALRRLAPLMREDKSDDVAPVLAAVSELARELDVAVIVLHNRSTKPGAPDVRGSSAIEDQADCVFVLERVEKDRDRARRRLRCTKHRPDGEQTPIWLRLEKVAGFMRWAGAEPFEPDERDSDEPEPKEQGRPEQIADRVRELAEQVLADDGWSPAQLGEAIGVDPGSGTFHRAMRLLVNGDEWDSFGRTRDRVFKPVSDVLSSQRPRRGEGVGGENDGGDQLEISPETLSLHGTPVGGPTTGENENDSTSPTDVTDDLSGTDVDDPPATPADVFDELDAMRLKRAADSTLIDDHHHPTDDDESTGGAS